MEPEFHLGFKDTCLTRQYIETQVIGDGFADFIQDQNSGSIYMFGTRPRLNSDASFIAVLNRNTYIHRGTQWTKA